jgi:hypothetical protein
LNKNVLQLKKRPNLKNKSVLNSKKPRKLNLNRIRLIKRLKKPQKKKKDRLNLT